MEFIKSLFTSQIGQAILITALLLGAGAVGKVWYDQRNVPVGSVEGERAEEVLEAAAAKLVEVVEADAEGRFPARAGWTPSALTCGAPVQVTPQEAKHPTWQALGLSFEEPTAYQYLFYADGERFTLAARADFDCDGFYQVYRIRGGKGVTGLGTERLAVDNPGE
ncbi:MAG: hypothetical protein CMH57_08090 [Myxococcales bacterium]|nr:hypothetical protein [Myxococcales bacterium]